MNHRFLMMSAIRLVVANRGELIGTNTGTSRFSRRRNSRHVRDLRNRGNGLEIRCVATGRGPELAEHECRRMRQMTCAVA
jgi:hypothetical protein